MAQIVLNIPDAILPRVVNALTFDYQPILEDGTPNPQTRNQYAKQVIINFIKNRIRQLEQNATIRNLSDSINNDITIT